MIEEKEELKLKLCNAVGGDRINRKKLGERREPLLLAASTLRRRLVVFAAEYWE